MPAPARVIRGPAAGPDAMRIRTVTPLATRRTALRRDATAWERACTPSVLRHHRARFLLLRILLQILVVPRENAILEVHALRDAVRRAMTAVDVAHPLDLFPEPPHRVVHLARLARRHVWILIAGDVEQRRLDPIGAQHGGVLEVPLRIVPQRAADAVLALLWCMRVPHAEPRTVGVEAD